MHRADDRKAVLGLRVADRVPACEQRPRGPDLLVGGGEDVGQDLRRQLFGKRRDRKREQRRAAHREDVVQRIRGRDRAVVGGIVDDGREEVEREDERSLVVETVDGRVVGRREPDQQVLGLDGRKAREQLLEARRRILGCAAPAGGEVGELDGGGFEIHGSLVSVPRNCRNSVSLRPQTFQRFELFPVPSTRIKSQAFSQRV